jgi:hypothetical protein
MESAHGGGVIQDRVFVDSCGFSILHDDFTGNDDNVYGIVRY